MMREFLADFNRGGLALGVKPVGNPIDRAQNSKRGQLGIGGPEDTGFDSVADDAPDTPVKAVSPTITLVRREGESACTSMRIIVDQ